MMRALYQKAVLASEMKCSPHLGRVAVDLDDELDLQCRQCLAVIVPLHSVDYYMNVLTNEEKLGSDFVVVRRQAYHGLTISKDMTLLEEEPFECIYLKKVACRRCNNSVGIYFETANLNGTAWLLSRIAINMDQISIISSELNLVETLKKQLQRLPPCGQSCTSERMKANYLAQENIVSALLKNAVDGTYLENKMKHSMVEEFIGQLEQLDSCISALEKRATTVVENADKYLQLYMKLFPQLKKQAREKDLMRRM